MAVLKSGASSDIVTVDPVSKALRETPYDAAGREVSAHSKATYAASSNFTPAATPTDLVIIEGSATKTLRIVSFQIETTTTAAGSVQFFLIKRSTADTTGTFVAAGNVAMDSNDAAATANRVGHFTANPGALGTAIGTIATKRVGTSLTVPGANTFKDNSVEMLPVNLATLLPRPVVLRGVVQCLAINFAGAALVAGQTHAYTIGWIEE